MSVASTTRTIKFISKAGTYTAIIMSPSGDLYQEYEGTMEEVTSVYPDFSVLKPVLNFVCTSSRAAEGLASPDSMKYFFNGVELAFDASGVSTGNYSGYFKKIAPSGDQLYFGLQILQDIAALAGYVPAVIKMKAVIIYGSQSDTIQASYNIPIQKATGSSYRVTIAAGDNKNFVIKEKGGSCILKALAYQSNSELTQNLTYTWEKMGTDGWEAIADETAQMLTVSADDIETSGEFRVHVFRSGNEIGSDIQIVMDASEPYEILAHPVPEDEAITEDTNGNDRVTYTPTVVKRGESTPAISTLFFFEVKDAAGVYLNSRSERETPMASYTVLREHCLAAGSDVAITIESQE